MNQKSNTRVLIALLLTFVFFACNSEKSTVETSPATPATESSEMTGYDPALDPVKVEAAFINLLADTLGVKLYDGVWKPGDSVEFHTHPDNIVYVLEGSTVELTNKDGTVNMVDFKTGMGMVGGSVTHKGKIIGPGNLRLVVADIYRPRN